MGSRRAGGVAPSREDRVHATVAYRGNELDELIAASSTQPSMTQAELTDYLDSLDTVAQRSEMISVSDLEELVPDSAFEAGYDDEAGYEDDDDGSVDCGPESVPVVESTVVIRGSAAHDALSVSHVSLSHASIAHVRAPSAFDSERPVSYEVPFDSTSMHALPPTSYTLESGIHAAMDPAPRVSARMPALITSTIAVVAITVGILLGSSLNQALDTGSASQVSAAVKAPEPHALTPDHVGLAGAGVVREKATRPIAPVYYGAGTAAGGGAAPRRSGASPSEADFTQRLEKAQKAGKPDINALNEALLNRPF